MKLPKTPIAIGASIALVAGLSACSAGGSGDASGDTTITWWATQQTGTVSDSVTAYEDSIAKFTEKTGIKVDVEVIPWADLYNKILTAVSSGSGPDVLSLGTTWTASLQDTGAFAELDDANLEALGGSDRFVQTVYEAAHVPDTVQTSVPLLSNVYSLYYNTKLFDEAGITEPPATWEDFVDVAKKLTKDTDGDGTIDQWGFSREAAAATGNAHFSFILGQQLGGDFVDADGKPTVDSPEQVKATEAFVDLMASDKVMPSNNAEFDLGADANDQMINGETAMIMSQNPVEQFQNRDFTDWAIAEMPVFEGGKNVQSMVAGTNISVFADSPNVEQSFEFIAHLTSAPEQAALASEFQMLPVVTAAYDEPQFAESGDDALAVRQEIQANASAPFPLVPNIGEIEASVGNAIREAFQAYATGGDPDVAGRLKTANGQLR